METKSRIAQLWDSFMEGISEQQWFQELRGKWDELDPQSRIYLKLGASVGSLLLVLVFVLNSLFTVYKLKKEFAAKTDLLTLTSAANDELRALRDANRGSTAPTTGGGAWPEYFQSSAANSGIDGAKISVSAETPGKAPAKGDKSEVTVKEGLYEITLKEVNIRQVVRYAYLLETGGRPVKIRNLGIDAKDDLSGFLNATLAISAFAVAEK